jgi:hypothetical protein
MLLALPRLLSLFANAAKIALHPHRRAFDWQAILQIA